MIADESDALMWKNGQSELYNGLLGRRIVFMLNEQLEKCSDIVQNGL